MARHEIPAGFTVGTKVIRSFGPNKAQHVERVITKVTKTLVTDDNGSRYYATIGTADNGELHEYGSQGMWPPILRLPENVPESKPRGQ